MDVIGKKYLYLLFSLIIIIPGIVSLILFGLNLSIEFSGGSRVTLSFPEKVTQKETNLVRDILNQENVRVSTVETSNNLIFVRTEPMEQKEDEKLITEIKKEYKEAKQEEFETIGPTIGKETTLNAFKAVLLATVFIVLYITWSFRKVPKPASSLRFGISAIFSLIHDVLVVVGLFSIFGYLWGVEVDSLFVTALLTVIGFSVHDTIVVFDRIRENLRRLPNTPFSKVVNDSILQTIDRSLNTSFTIILVLITMLLFGGDTIRWFVVALLIGIVSGTYSSIFNAAPLLVIWQEFSDKRKKN